MEVLEKLDWLSQACDLDAGEEGCRNKLPVKRDGIMLTQTTRSDGKTSILLKTLLTSVCEHDCLYCPFRAGRDFPRMSFKPEEFASLSDNLTRAGIIQGVFLSSGVVGSGARTQDRLIATAEILRRKYVYQGYLHLKIMPGVEYDQVIQVMRLADRVSINLEAPNAERLPNLAPRKHFEDELFKPLRWIEHIRRTMPPVNTWKGHWPASCTQFVVGAANETDLELLRTTQTLHRSYGLLRAYFSAFQPHRDTPLENHEPTSHLREHRLYQADYLIRDYGFSEDELVVDAVGNLLQTHDPKLTWAERHLQQAPVEINNAGMETLLRVPGIGPKGARAIIAMRRMHRIRDISALFRCGINTKQVKEFILMDGIRPASQPALF